MAKRRIAKLIAGQVDKLGVGKALGDEYVDKATKAAAKKPRKKRSKAKPKVEQWEREMYELGYTAADIKAERLARANPKSQLHSYYAGSKAETGMDDKTFMNKVRENLPRGIPFEYKKIDNKLFDVLEKEYGKQTVVDAISKVARKNSLSR